MLNHALLTSQDELNAFTTKLKDRIERQSPVLCELRSGIYIKITLSRDDEGNIVSFHSEDWAYCWNLDGSSYTSSQLDIIGFDD